MNIASLGGLYAMPPTPVYSATKHAVVGYSRSLRGLRSHGIRVNCLCPSFTDTDMVAQGMQSSQSLKQTVKSTGTQHSLTYARTHFFAHQCNTYIHTCIHTYIHTYIHEPVYCSHGSTSGCL